MNRNYFLKTIALSYLSTIFLKSCESDKNEKNNSTINEISTLKEYDKEFDYRTVRNFLSRVTCSFNEEDIHHCSKLGLKSSIDFVMREMHKPNLPVNFEYENDINTPIGETWIYSPMSNEFNFEHYRKKSIEAWLSELIYNHNASSITQMMLFWHNLFPVSDLM